MGIHRLCALAVTQPLEELVERSRFRPQFMNTYPSTGALLAEEQLAGRLRLRPRGPDARTASRSRPSLRERLELAFGVRPTDFYATTEGLYGQECEMGSMHLFDDMCIVENVDEDGDPVPLARWGRACSSRTSSTVCSR